VTDDPNGGDKTFSDFLERIFIARSLNSALMVTAPHFCQLRVIQYSGLWSEPLPQRRLWVLAEARDTLCYWLHDLLG
jgi:hypothetical protein